MKASKIGLFNLSNYVRPEIKEEYGRKWVLNGRNNEFFKYIIDRYKGSTTNNAIINAYTNMLYGQGITLNGSNNLYEPLYELINKRDIRKLLTDFKMFGMYAMQIIRSRGGGVAEIKHLPVNNIGFEKMDDDGEINAIYYSDNWENIHRNPPERIPIFKGKMTDAIMVKVVVPYMAGNLYYGIPDYMASLQYSEIEEEIGNFSINHIKNGLSFGYVININNGGGLSAENKDEIERKIKQKLTGSENAGKFIISFNDGKEFEVTFNRLEVNDAHNQWESLREDAKQQIMTSHGVISPLLFALPSAGGFGSNADEMDTATKILNDFQIKPKQQMFIDELASILELNNLETDLVFKDLRDTYKSTETPINSPVADNVIDDEIDADVEMSSEYQDLNELLNCGEDVDENEWELIDENRADVITIKESDLNTVFKFATLPIGDSRKASEQDTSLFKIRYGYAGKPVGQRDFCKKMLASGKVYRAEDLDKNLFVQRGMGPNGTNKYNVFKYKGGVNCKHFWQRKIYLKRNNNVISVNKARKMILELDPSERKDAKWAQNDKIVAQPAQANNNYFRLK